MVKQESKKLAGLFFGVCAVLIYIKYFIDMSASLGILQAMVVTPLYGGVLFYCVPYLMLGVSFFQDRDVYKTSSIYLPVLLFELHLLVERRMARSICYDAFNIFEVIMSILFFMFLIMNEKKNSPAKSLGISSFVCCVLFSVISIITTMGDFLPITGFVEFVYIIFSFAVAGTRIAAFFFAIRTEVPSENLYEHKVNVSATYSGKKTSVSSFDIAEDIKILKELLDMEAITQEEFDNKKKEILGL